MFCNRFTPVPFFFSLFLFFTFPEIEKAKRENTHNSLVIELRRPAAQSYSRVRHHLPWFSFTPPSHPLLSFYNSKLYPRSYSWGQLTPRCFGYNSRFRACMKTAGARGLLAGFSYSKEMDLVFSRLMAALLWSRQRNNTLPPSCIGINGCRQQNAELQKEKAAFPKQPHSSFLWFVTPSNLVGSSSEEPATSFSQNMKAWGSSRMFASTYQATRCHNPEDHNWNLHRHEDLTRHTNSSLFPSRFYCSAARASVLTNFEKLVIYNRLDKLIEGTRISTLQSTVVTICTIFFSI